MKVSAAVVREPGGEFCFEELQLSAPRPDEVVVRLLATGICHTDLTARDGHLAIFGLPYPCVLGHEGVGDVVATGSAVQGVAVGDRVIISGAHCGDCEACLGGRAVYCPRAAVLGFSGRRSDGSSTLTDANGQGVGGGFVGQSSFATHALARVANVVKVPSGIPPSVLAPVACGFSTGAGAVWDVLRPQEGSKLGVFGAGTVGLSAIMAAKVAGCGDIIAVDVRDDRLELATRVGATHVINAQKTDPVDEIRRLTGGGIDFAVESAGVAAVASQAVQSTTPTGTTALLGVPAGDAHFAVPWFAIATGRTVCGVVLGGTSPRLLVPRVLELYRRKLLPLEELVTEYRLLDIEKAIADMSRGSTIKPVLVMPEAESAGGRGAFHK